MQNRYFLRSAIMLNATGKKFDAVAVKISGVQIRKHQHQFKDFDFAKSLREGFCIYKICKEGEEDILQGLVAVKHSTGFLECGNMETNDFNKHPINMYNYVGKSIVALCCKISRDEGFGGYIAFYAKNHLFAYYSRYGAVILFGNRMFIDNQSAEKLIELYF